MANEFVEDVLLLDVVGGIVLGMPLGGDDPRRRFQLDRLDHAVGGSTDNPQAIADGVESLVMNVMAVLWGVGAERFGETRTGVEFDGEVLVPMGLGADVLYKRAAARDVQQLDAATQTEHRDVPFDRGAHDGQFHGVVLVDDPVHLLSRLHLTVAKRVDVTSAVEHHAVDAMEEIAYA